VVVGGGGGQAPALRAHAIAEWIVDGAPAIDLSEIAPARFAGREVDENELRERCRRAYATHYRAGSETPAGAGCVYQLRATIEAPWANANLRYHGPTVSRVRKGVVNGCPNES
jgi:hypothetical protein